MLGAPGGDGPYGRRLRQLHLAIASLISGLAISGFIFHYRRTLGLQDYKLELLIPHVFLAYLLLCSVVWRIIVGTKGIESDRFRHVFARTKDIKRLIGVKESDKSRLRFAGRSPLSRVIATSFYLAVSVNIATGLIRAGTDLYLPPFGPLVLGYVAPEGERASIKAVKAGAFNKERMQKVRSFKKPVSEIHFIGAFIITFIALLHVIGVLLTEWSAPSGQNLRGRARIMLFGPGKAR